MLVVTKKDSTILKLIEISTKKVIKSKQLKRTEFVPVEDLADNYTKFEGIKRGAALVEAGKMIRDLNISGVEVCEKRRRLLIQMKGKRDWSYHCFFISYKLDNLFGDIHEGVVISKEIEVGRSNSLMRAIEGEKVLVLTKAPDQHKNEIPVWLDPDTLEEAKICNTNSIRDFSSSSQDPCSGKQYSLPCKIGEKLLLLVGKTLFTLFDYKEKKIVTQFRHAPGMDPSRSLNSTTVDNQIFWTCSDRLYITTLSHEDNHHIEKVQRINLLDYLPQTDDLKLEKDYSLFKLESGNLVYLGARSVLDPSKKPDYNPKDSVKTVQGFILVICPKTLKVLHINEQKKEDTDRALNFNELYLANEDYILSVMERKEQIRPGGNGEEKSSYGLGLWDREFNFLDQNFDYELNGFGSIQAIDNDHVAAKGSENNFLLFKIDVESRKIIPKKNLRISAKWITDVIKEENSPREFKCIVGHIQTGNRIKEVLMKFNSQLELLTWTSSYQRRFD